MLKRRDFIKSSAAFGATLLGTKNLYASSKPPTVYKWVGNSAETLYWDDPNNWENSSYPNGREAVAVFSDSIRQDTNIILRKDITLAQFWISESNSITFSPEGGETTTPSKNPKFILETSRQLASLFIDIENSADHRFGSWILHSCYWNGSHRDILSPRLPDSEITTIHYDANIGNYKPAEKASLQVDGNLAIQLNGKNSFVGPVSAKQNGRIRINANGAIPDGSMLELDSGGTLVISDGITVKAAELKVNGNKIQAGIYGGKNSTKTSAKSLVGIEGKGAILVGN